MNIVLQNGGDDPKLFHIDTETKYLNIVYFDSSCSVLAKRLGPNYVSCREGWQNNL